MARAEVLLADRILELDAKDEQIARGQLIDVRVEMKRAVREEKIVLGRVQQRHIVQGHERLQVQIGSRGFVVLRREESADRRRALREREIRLGGESRRVCTANEERDQRHGLREMSVDLARNERPVRREGVDRLHVQEMRIVR